MTHPPADPDGRQPDPGALSAAARVLGVDCRVEVDGRLAVLVPTDPGAVPPDAATRRRLVGAARDAGFTHVALELPGAAEEAR